LFIVGYCDVWDLMLKFGHYSSSNDLMEIMNQHNNNHERSGIHHNHVMTTTNPYDKAPRSIHSLMTMKQQQHHQKDEEKMVEGRTPHFVSPITTSSRCSAIVKPLKRKDCEDEEMIKNQVQQQQNQEENDSDLISDVQFGHTTWDTYATASPRILKTFIFPSWKKDKDRGLDEIQQVEISLSSSPGLLMASLDDFYIQRSRRFPSSSDLVELKKNGKEDDVEYEIESLLGIQETTNGILNMELYDLVTIESHLCWLRVQIANTMARNGDQWSGVFSNIHSGNFINCLILFISFFE